MEEPVQNKLEQRLGRLHAKLRLRSDRNHEKAQIFGQVADQQAVAALEWREEVITIK